jgi:hypothetical protein
VTRYELLSAASSIGALVIGLATLVALLWQLRLLVKQVALAANATRLDHERRRRQATLDFYATTLAKRSELRAVLPYDRNVAGVHALLARAVDEEDEAGNAITGYLSLFESLGAGVRDDVYSFPVVEAVAGGRVLAIVENYRPWIEDRRRHFQNPRLYEHLEWLADQIARHRAAAPDRPARR